MASPARSPTACSTSRPRPSSGPTSATTSRSRPTRCSTRSCRATWRGTARRPTWWPTASTRPWSIWWCGLVDGAEYKRRQMPPGRAHHDQGLRQGPPHADHQPLPPRRADRGHPAPPRRPSRPSPTVPEVPLPPDVTWRTIDQLAERVGEYCWVEHRLFELTGRPGPAGAGRRRRESGSCSARCRPAMAPSRCQWRDRLPVRAGVDVAALVVAPSRADADALDLLRADPTTFSAWAG